jgi:hypothetical protein
VFSRRLWNHLLLVLVVIPRFLCTSLTWLICCVHNGVESQSKKRSLDDSGSREQVFGVIIS